MSPLSDFIDADRVREMARRLDTVTLDRDCLVGKLEEVRGERDDAIDERAVLARLLEQAEDERDDARAKVRALDEERADLARRLEVAEDERDALRAPKVAGVEWRGTYLYVGGSKVSWVDQPRIDRWRVGTAACGALGTATSKESAMRLAELLANHDPGGTWRVNGDVVSPDTVRLVCPSVAVTWEATP